MRDSTGMPEANAYVQSKARNVPFISETKLDTFVARNRIRHIPGFVHWVYEMGFSKVPVFDSKVEKVLNSEIQYGGSPTHHNLKIICGFREILFLVVLKVLPRF